MAWKEQEKIPISELFLDPKNSRLDSQSHAESLDNEEVLQKMWQENRTGIMKIIKNIANNGWGPDTLVIEKNEKNKYVIMEGNTRFCAILLLNNPSLCPQSQWKNQIQNHLSKIHNQNNQEFLKRIPCTLGEGKEIEKYVRGRHTSGEEYSIKPWKSKHKQNHEERFSAPGDYPITSAISKKFDIEIPEASISTLERIFSKKDALEAIGLSFIEDADDEKQKLYITHDNTESIIREIFSNIKNKQIDSRGLNTTKQINNYIASLKNKKGTKKDEQELVDGGEKRKRKRKNNNNKYLLKKNTDYIFGYGQSAKIEEIFKELSTKLVISEMPYATAFTLRCFVELSVSHYCEKNSITGKKRTHEKIQQALTHMIKNNILERNNREKILQAIHTHMPSLDTMNYIMHCPDYHSDSASIKAFWQNINVFVKACWQE